MTPSLLTIEETPEISVAVETACARVPPLWPLQNFVAVNPFMGLREMQFREASQLMARVAHGPILMSAEYFLDRIRDGSILASDITAALARHGDAINPTDPVAWLTGELQEADRSEQILTVADWLDRRVASNWAGFVVEEVSKWCSSYFDRGQSSWIMPWKGESLYASWKQAAAIDANPEVFGMAGFRAHVRGLPESEEAAIEVALARLQVPEDLAVDFLHRQLISVLGWCSYAAYLQRQGEGSGFVRQILAIRLAYDSALLALAPGWRCQVTQGRNAMGSVYARSVAQFAAENSFRSGLAGKLESIRPESREGSRKQLQAVFCIDVRSEVYRRALEAQGAGIETIGFAGFFGMPIALESSARCPVLISPQYQVHAGPRPEKGWLVQRAKTAWKHLSSSASACFPTVEVAGAWFGVELVTQSGRKQVSQTPAPELVWSIPLQARVDLAAGALKNMGLDAGKLANVVLLCGHGGRTENNPYGSSLDCGACGGHKGDVNASFAAALMNDPAVREGLRERGSVIPSDTVFVSALHNTTTDDVALFDGKLLSGEQFLTIKGWLESASRKARAERAGAPVAKSEARLSGRLERESRQRSADWSEVRPEWGLAGNAAFIAAPRARTKALDLKGRVFLHDYDAAGDPDSSVLELILTAPVVVASWINLQYYASTVNNRVFGSGNKVLHNVVGTFGVWEGNGGDIRTGLPLQSLHDGVKWMHEPLRLQVFVEAPTDRIDAVLQANPEVAGLADNGWIHLMSMARGTVYERRGRANWGGQGD